ncbi:TPA: hypothetical protein N0F65_008420 [Lagenidium giganteum]|uniref:Uncharacterized protein n=1 Tax=Lagenidium giganteum TaxID=4803 RepID=A0AAV2YYI8_9STRA|nr:TPA: hypothetical protein N0F65_008420 [Lagenidium giganteum]
MMAQLQSEAERQLIELPVRVSGQTNERVLKFECDWDVGIGGSVWTSGELLTSHLGLQHDKYAGAFNGKTIVELGSGTGFVGMMTAVAFEPARVFLTDLASHLHSMKRNVDINREIFVDGTQVHVRELAWGVQDHTAAFLRELRHSNDSTGSVDVILGTDVAYLEELYEPLLATLNELATPETLILLGLNRNDTSIAFFRRLEQEGYEFYKISDREIDPNFRGKDFGLFEIHRRLRPARSG